MAKTLQLNFSTANGKNMMLSVDEPRADLTTPEVEATMQAVIASGGIGWVSASNVKKRPHR